MEPGGSGFCPERSPFIDADWHFRQAGYLPHHHHHHHQHLDHHTIHSSKMFMEKMEPGSSSDLCRCYTCSSAGMMHRLPARPHNIFPDAAPEWCQQVKDFGAAGKGPCLENAPSPCFSVRTPIRKDSPALLQSDSPCNAASGSMPPRMCMGYSPQNPGFLSYSLDHRQAFLHKPTEKQIILHRWFLIKLAEDPTTVALGGYVTYGYDTEFVKTGPIADRIEKVRLRTQDGTEVRLMGVIDEQATIANGFPISLSNLFFSGFPLTWKHHLHLRNGSEENRENVSTPVVEKNMESLPDGGEQGACPETPAASIPGVPQAGVEELPGAGVVANEAIQPGEPAREKENPDESAAEDQVEKTQAAEDAPVVKRPQARKRVMNRLPTRSSKRLNKGKEKENQESDGSNDSSREKQEGGDEGKKSDEEVVKDKLTFPLKPPEPEAPAAAENELSGEQQQQQEIQVEEEVVVEVEVEVPASQEVPQTRQLSSSRKRARRTVSRGSRKRKAPTRKVIEENKDSGANDGENKEQQPGVAQEAPEEKTPEPGVAEDRQEVDESIPAGKASDTEKEEEVEVEEVNDTEKEEEVEVEEVNEHRELVEVQEPEEAKDNIKRVISKRRSSRARKTTTTTSRRRKQKESSDQKRGAPAVEVRADSDDHHQQPIKPGAGASKQLNPRSKRSALPPPLPASRVAKSEVIEAYGLKTSRSGRLLVPPLAYWRNQTLALDKDGGIIAIMDGFAEPPSDTGIFNFKPPSEKKRLQEKLCAAAQDSGSSKSTDKGKKKVRGSK